MTLAHGMATCGGSTREQAGWKIAVKTIILLLKKTFSFRRKSLHPGGLSRSPLLGDLFRKERAFFIWAGRGAKPIFGGYAYDSTN